MDSFFGIQFIVDFFNCSSSRMEGMNLPESPSRGYRRFCESELFHDALALVGFIAVPFFFLVHQMPVCCLYQLTVLYVHLSISRIQENKNFKSHLTNAGRFKLVSMIQSEL